MPTYAKSAATTQASGDESPPASSKQPAGAAMRKPSAQQAAGANASSGQLSSLSSNNSSSGDEMKPTTLSSNADYDHLRNTTLMFFLDRLFIASKDGKEARTLHDLSCLFGTRDFTKEMRQIVGASRNGLKKFLQSYPSLFTIEGDKVYLTQLEQETNSSRARDYNKEAVEYFSQKLVQFGASLVPIRNLFGYRSQASQEVRHVSGKNTKEFKQFLAAHEDVFELLPDEHVVLKSALKELELKGELATSRLQQQLLQAGEEVVVDPYLNKQFAHSIEECLKKILQEETSEESGNEKRVTIQFLHERILEECQNQLFLKMVKTIEDFKVFLRMHPKIFKRVKCDQDGRDYVSLLTEEERREMEIQAFPSLLTRQHSTLKRCDTNESTLSSLAEQAQAASLPHYINNANHPGTTTTSTNASESPDNKTKQTAWPKQDASRQQQATSPSPNNSAPQANSGHSSLRATAPPFIPSSLHSLQHQSQPDSHKQAHFGPARPVQRSVSNLTSGLAGQQQQQRAVIDPRHALRSYLMKASAENAAPAGLYSPAKHSNGGQQSALIHKPLSRQSSALQEDLRARTVNIVREASNIITRIMTTTDAVALDCKGYNLGFNGQITMIQLAYLPTTSTSASAKLTSHHQLSSAQQQLASNPATAAVASDKQQESQSNGTPAGGALPRLKPEVCVFDLITNPELAYCLKPLLESEQIVKIVHDVRNKSNLLYSQFSIMLNHVFDTQVANLVIQQQETGKPAYKSRYISMSRLCEIYGDEMLMKYRNKIRTKHSSVGGGNQQNNSSSSSGKTSTKDVNYWKTRPLTDAMVYESTMDVYCLVGGVYQNLKAKIKPEYAPLFEQLNLEGVLARIKPDEIRGVKKERKIDLEVIDLKRKLYSDATSSIVLSNREIRLLRHIDLTDEVRNKIQQCKKVAKKLERLDMKAAQNAQLLQSMTSQLSSMEAADGAHSLNPSASLQTNGSSQSPSSTQGDADNENNNTPAKGSAEPEIVDEANGLDETGMGNLMDGSMFDELKDKMIESSSLLESLEDDDEEVGLATETDHNVQANSSIGNHSDHSGSHDDCKCNCHKDFSSMKSSASSVSASTSTTDKEDSNPESKAVDMAIQCDLLS